MSAWRASFCTVTGAVNSSEFIKPEDWQGLIHSEILNQCDALNGVGDGILIDPALCTTTFRFEALLCDPIKATNCLTAHQVEIIRKVFRSLHGFHGELIYLPLALGAEVQATQRLLSGTPFPYSVDWFRYAVYADPSWILQAEQSTRRKQHR